VSVINPLQQYNQHLDKFLTSLDNFKGELINLVRFECKTYADVKRFLLIRKKEALWNDNRVLAEIIDEIICEFEKEKDDLSVK
jgi:hypothetical protein